MHYALNKVKPLPCAREFEALNKWVEVALEKEREKFRSKFRGHWNKWIEENSGSSWKVKQWREETMKDAEKLIPVIEVKEENTPKSKRNNKARFAPKLKRKNGLD